MPRHISLPGVDPGFLLGGPKFAEFGSDRTVELFCGKLLLTTRTTTCFSICERRSLLAQKILYCFSAEANRS